MNERLSTAALDWSDAGPVSRTFGDVYFSAEGGLAEARAVFLAGCGLPDAWSSRDRYVLAETGFGTGLNILAALDLWRATRRPEARLHVFSVEAHPLLRADAARAHAAWPELGEISQAMLAQWPSPTPGFHRIDLPELDATLDVGHGEAAEMLRAWHGRADAWFLDGFAPSANPDMWRDEVLGLIARRSAPGARLASFTVAGAVRRGLAAQGFTVTKAAGHGRKRERLEAVLPGPAPKSCSRPRVIVVGAGIAGAAVVRALRRQGVEPLVVEAEAPGTGGSGAPAALVTPRLDAGQDRVAALGTQAFQRAVDMYRREIPGAVLAEGVLRLARDDRDAARFARIADQPLWPERALSVVDTSQASALVGEPIERPGLWMSQALAIEPPTVLAAWLAEAEILRGAVVEISGQGSPRVRLSQGPELTADVVILTAGWGAATLGVPGLAPVRGQLFWTEGFPTRACVWGSGYCLPTRTGVLVGATHDRGRTDTEASPDDTSVLLKRLAVVRPGLAGRLADASLTSRAAVRATTPDHLPLCGPIRTGLWALGGLGGRGFAWAPLLAEHLVAGVTGTPSPLPSRLAPLIEPVRPSISGGTGTADREP